MMKLGKQRIIGIGNGARNSALLIRQKMPCHAKYVSFSEHRDVIFNIGTLTSSCNIGNRHLFFFFFTKYLYFNCFCKYLYFVDL